MHAIAVTILFAGTLLSAPVPKTQPVDPDKLAKEVAEEFIRAFQKRDTQAMLKTVDVPFFADRKEVTERKDLEKLIEGLENKNEVPVLTIESIGSMDKFLEAMDEKFRRKLPEDWAASMKKQIGPDGRVLLIQAVVPNRNHTEKAVMLVRIKDREAKIIGISD